MLSEPAPAVLDAAPEEARRRLLGDALRRQACDTDAKSHLRNVIPAKAYFAFSATVYSRFAEAVRRYLIAHLARHTRSTEETYYDILRVANTRYMITTRTTSSRTPSES